MERRKIMGNSQSRWLCHECAIALNEYPQHIPFNLSGSRGSYKWGKFFKHTVPGNHPGINSVFDSQTYEDYQDYIINAFISGSVEKDSRGNFNIVWAVGRNNGFTEIEGVVQCPTDSVKIVLPWDPEKIHGFATGSADWSKVKCENCGRTILK